MLRTTRALVTSAVLFSGCTIETIKYRERPVDDAGAASMDAASTDGGGRDAGERDAATADAAADGGLDEDAGPCGVCAAGRSCEPVGGSCVDCVTDAHCLSRGTPACSAAFQCVACVSDGNCTRFTDTLACHMGECAECSATNDAACGTNVCDVRRGVCTSLPERSAGACSPCVSDDQCRTGTSCVVMRAALDVGGDAELGAFCLPLPSGGTCSNPYGPTSSMLPAVGTDTPVAVCRPVRSCQALADLGVVCASDSDCGATGFADGSCRAGRCTTFCNADPQCLVGWTCPASGPDVGLCVPP